jgi:broad specificity phosphatase PhoE
MMDDDPPLSASGRDRAEHLARLLRSVGITGVHSTDYTRTRSTAQPVSDAAGLAIDLYDPEDMDGLAGRLRATPGIHLVVGHSNTTADLVQALGGEPGEAIAPLEYDRIYVVRVLPGGATGSAVFRYGSPYGGAP